MKTIQFVVDYLRTNGSIWALILIIGSGVYLLFGDTDTEAHMHEIKGVFTGRLPKPSEPDFFQPLHDLAAPKPNYQLKRISHIPMISYDQTMPHPYVGVCKYCHLFKGGAPAGSLPKTPIGAMLEEFSKDINKLGPDLLPTSQRPHPAAGRCVKCHDFYVKVPLDNAKDLPNSWRL